MFQDVFRERLKERRRELRLTQAELGEQIGVTRQTVFQWERGTFAPDMNRLESIAEVLQCSASWLLGESSEKDCGPLDAFYREPFESSEDFVRVALMDDETVACAGHGFEYSDAYVESSKTVVLPRKTFSSVDSERPPFGINVAGDSMEGAGIFDGSIAIINPAETVHPGDATLVCYNDRWSIKWLIPKNNGDVELRSANSSYQPMLIPQELACREEWFRVIGKVVKTMTIKSPAPYF